VGLSASDFDQRVVVRAIDRTRRSGLKSNDHGVCPMVERINDEIAAELIEREEIPVMFVRAVDDEPERIREAWERPEDLRGSWNYCSMNAPTANGASGGTLESDDHSPRSGS
jgi:hypothetical protein